MEEHQRREQERQERREQQQADTLRRLEDARQSLPNAIPEDEYLRASGGIPKDWNDKYGVGGIPDPYRGIYHPDPG